MGIFLKFQSQSWHTDDRTGQALPAVPVPPTEVEHDGVVRIVAVLVNDTHAPEQETITLLNTSPTVVSLDGWILADKNRTLEQRRPHHPPG